MQPDVIGIGAINFDYVYAGGPEPDDARPGLEVGRETLNVASDELEGLITRHSHRSTIVSKQVGGSAYLAVRTIASMSVGLRTGYVGVLGTRTQMDEQHGFPNTDVTECLDDTRWLFRSDSPPGRSLVHIWRGQRLEIRIAPGANTELLDRIRSVPDGDNKLASYLASARWVHVSSLPDFTQFLEIMRIVGLAKASNRSLRCSLDPGYEYVRYHPRALIDTLDIADLVFLSRTEAAILSPGKGMEGGSPLAGMSFGQSTKLIVIKGRASNILIEHTAGGRVATRTFWHKHLWAASIKNDTGAGDVFAGGFIAALMMDRLLGSQPTASRLAANLAAVRLGSHDYPTNEIARATTTFVEQNLRREGINRRERFQVIWEQHRGWIVFLAGAVASYAVTTLLSYLIAGHP